MTEPTGPLGPRHGDDDGELDVTAFLTGDDLARIEAEARDAVRATPAGVADMSAGTVRMPAADPAPTVVEGLVVEQLDEDDDQDGAPALRRVIPETFLDPQVWRHRRAVAANAAAFHAVRAPKYGFRMARVVIIGARVAAGDAWGKVFATEYRDGLRKVKRNRDKVNWTHVAELQLERAQVARERRRDTETTLAATTATTYTAALVAIGQVWGLALVVPALLPLVVWLYRVGARELADRVADGVASPYAILDAVADAGRAPLGADTITAAFRRAGLIKDDEEVELVGPVRAVAIHAAEAVIDLPGTLTLSDLIKERERLAKGFRVRPEWLDLSEAGDPGRVRLWVATQDPLGELRPSPLISNPERTDVWNVGILVGYNRRGEPVYLKLRHVMALLGGMSRTGKGMFLRNLICGLGLDPRVNIRLVAGAKPGEHRGYAPICATFFGRRPERLIALLDAVLEEAYRREDYLEEIGRAKLGEKDLDRFPLEILIIDEYKQYATSSARIPDPSDPEGKRTIKAADRIAEQLETLAAFAAALNITILVSTQDPDAKTIPRGFKSNSGARVATRTGGPTQTNAILKEGATGAGLRAHDIPESLKGAAIVDIDGAAGQLIRGFFIEDEEYDGAEPVIAAGRALRESLNRAPGQFADAIEEYLVYMTGASSVGGGPSGSGRPAPPEGGAGTSPPRGILDLILDAFPTDADRVPMADVRAYLAEYDVDMWGPNEDEEQAAYEARVGKLLAAEIDEALDGTDVELKARQVRMPDGKRPTGYVRAEVEVARDAARNARK